MKKHLILILILSLLLGTAIAHGAWTEVDTFEDGNLDDWTLLLDEEGTLNPDDPATITIVPDPTGTDNNVMAMYAGGIIENTVNAHAHRPLNPAITDPGIGNEDQAATFFFRVLRPQVEVDGVSVPGQLDHVWGLLDSVVDDNPSAYGDYSVMSRYAHNKGGVMDVHDGGYTAVGLDDGEGGKQPMATDTWYSLWYVIRHGQNTFDLYIQGGDQFPEQTLLYENAEYRKKTFEPLITFAITTSAGNLADGLKSLDNGYFDDIYVDITGANLTSPVGDTPTPTTAIPGATELGDNWESHPVFGVYNVTFWPWAFHINLGFVYVFEPDGADYSQVFFFHNGLGEIFFTSFDAGSNVAFPVAAGTGFGPIPTGVFGDFREVDGAWGFLRYDDGTFVTW